MANLTNAWENEVLDYLLLDTTRYLALFTADPTETGSVTNELSGSGYARASLSGKFSAASGGEASNTAIISFATATADWDEVTHVGVMESGTASTDDMILWLELDEGITTLNTKAFKFAIGDLTFTAA